ncbi:MAG: bifunctional phosphopantothenoylcysteine decarboxylase/phosphopantothenate--cysteine ligase CoaBC [Muribaculaceae bacterium]|nr:bifunctional phosphopantothenoylcysteine decarboxylase/phosphopantothenate--cysteine ligase CoaBC [Muribaculaceae bacterium]
MGNLKDKHIILGISGGIAAYKSVYLLRLLVKAGAQVQVVITPNGKEFITPVTLSSLSGRPVISEFFSANTGEWHSHVDLGLWADAMVIAPATASTIAKMANGVADNMLITTYLSAKAPVFIAPAMDLDMMAHPTTTRNLAFLRSIGNKIIEPKSGELASHLVGKGRMEEPESIALFLEQYFAQKSDLIGKKVLITAGPTVEKIDPVRYISNFSSGKMGYALAAECAARGAEVTLVSGPVSIPTPKGEDIIKVESGREMCKAAVDSFNDSDIAIMCAAVADYYVENYSNAKIKREEGDIPELILKKNPDIAATLGKKKSGKQILIGFALETDNEVKNAGRKIERKNLDFIVVNSMKNPDSCFGADTNTIQILNNKGEITSFENKPKPEVATDIINYLTTHYL